MPRPKLDLPRLTVPELTAAIKAESHGVLSLATIRTVLELFALVVQEQVAKEGKALTLPRLGTFWRHYYKPRKLNALRGKRTIHQPMVTQPRYKVVFSAGGTLQQAVPPAPAEDA